MSNTALDVARMLDMLPAEEQTFAYEFVKRLVKAWDADYTMVTPDEARQIEAAEHSGFIDDSDIDWEYLGIDGD